MNILLIKYGEIALRGANRHLFESRLINAIQNKIRKLGSYTVSKEQGRFLIQKEGGVDFDRLIPAVITVLGVVAVCPAVLLKERDMDSIKRAALNQMKDYCDNKPHTYKVETKRADKSYPMESREISAEVGEYILENMDNMTVDVKTPEITLNVELRNNVYVFSKVIKGLGGLPVGSSGKGLVLLSGGIDSPVAAFLMAKRGMELEAVYFHSPPFTSERAKLKVTDLAERLTEYMGTIKLHIIPFTDIQLLLKQKCPPEKLTLLLKRAMLRIAQMIGDEIKAGALITGDSIGQVASQTVRSINAVNSAASMPVLRPLAGFDKQEIVDLAKKLGTFDISIRPYEDCCTLFVADHPETNPKTSIIESVENKLMPELNVLFFEALEKREIMKI